MQEKVSVIVPVYNVEQYINKCIESILNQTYQNLEIILVDDGSTDSSGKICDKFAEQSPKVIVIHKQNGGLSDARNAGLNLCTGDYITFVDPDDYLLPNYVNALTRNIHDADICISSYCTLYRGTIYKPQYKFDRREYKGDAKQHLLEHLLLEKADNEEFPSRLVAVWKNLYKADLIKTNNLLFVSERQIYMEDYIFNLYAYYFSKSIAVISDANIVYRIRKGSLSNGYREFFYEMQKQLINTVEDFIQENLKSDLLDDYRKTLPTMLAYSLFKENLTSKECAYSNTERILSDQYAINILSTYGKCESRVRGSVIKESIIYYLAKHHRVGYIYWFVKFISLCEPIYRIMKLKKQKILQWLHKC